MVEARSRPLAFFRLYPAPLDREPVRTETECLHHVEILGPAVPAVARIAARLDTTGARCVLEDPPVVVDVATLDLVSGGSGPPQEPVRKVCRRHETTR